MTSTHNFYYIKLCYWKWNRTRRSRLESQITDPKSTLRPNLYFFLNSIIFDVIWRWDRLIVVVFDGKKSNFGWFSMNFRGGFELASLFVSPELRQVLDATVIGEWVKVSTFSNENSPEKFDSTSIFSPFRSPFHYFSSLESIHYFSPFSVPKFFYCVYVHLSIIVCLCDSIDTLWSVRGENVLLVWYWGVLCVFMSVCINISWVVYCFKGNKTWVGLGWGRGLWSGEMSKLVRWLLRICYFVFREAKKTNLWKKMNADSQKNSFNNLSGTYPHMLRKHFSLVMDVSIKLVA